MSRKNIIAHTVDMWGEERGEVSWSLDRGSHAQLYLHHHINISCPDPGEDILIGSFNTRDLDNILNIRIKSVKIIIIVVFTFH